MFKFILALIIGLGLGGAAGYFKGTEDSTKIHIEILHKEQEISTQKISDCNEQKTKIEEQLKTINAELQLNESRSCFVSSAPLSPPEFEPANLDALGSDKKGEILLKWSPVKGAKHYVVTVEDQAGTVVSTTEIEGETLMYLNRIPHTTKLEAADYFVRIATVNGLDQIGQQGERKPVHFNTQSFKPTKKQKSKKRK